MDERKINRGDGASNRASKKPLLRPYWQAFLKLFKTRSADPFRASSPTSFPPSLPLRLKKLKNFKGELPDYKSQGASGFDLRACLDKELVIESGQRVLVPTGLSFEVPAGFELQARPRSGLALNQGLTVLNSPGTIDSDYRGEIKILLLNTGTKNVRIKDQDRVAQLVLCPVFKAQFIEWSELSKSQRGEGGFGSTGL